MRVARHTRAHVWRSSRTRCERRRQPQTRAAADGVKSTELVKKEGASTDLRLISQRLGKLIRPYWFDNPDANKPRLALGGVVVLSLMCTGVSVVFSFLGRDFFNALNAKDEATFYSQLVKYLCGFAVGIPIFVFRDFFMSVLALRWREWMTESMLSEYMSDKAYYNIAAGQVVDNPDQRLTADINNFTSSTLSLSFTFLTSVVDLVSFAGILFTIYPPLLFCLVGYAFGGTAVSFIVGKKLVGLNFKQEAREADLRYGLVRVRENAESIAFYGGASSEVALLVGRLGRVVANYRDLITASRNLDFFQSAYRYIIILLPAAVVAPLYFRGEIEFGVVNQSQSAFSHILSDVSLVVYQFESLAGFSAVVDRLGEFQETVEAKGRFTKTAEPSSGENGAESSVDEDPVETVMPPGSVIDVRDTDVGAEELVSVADMTLCTPKYERKLVSSLNLVVTRETRLVITGPSGCGKTSLLRALAGLWVSGTGCITRPPLERLTGQPGGDGMLFIPQKPYMVLGSLRQQLLYPVYDTAIISEALANFDEEDGQGNLLDPQTAPILLTHNGSAEPKNGGSGTSPAAEENGAATRPSDEELCDTLRMVGLGSLLDRETKEDDSRGPLDVLAQWSSVLSLGEQQRLAFARLLLAKPALALLDESTSALDLTNEARLYNLLQEHGIAYVSVGHRSSLMQFHNQVLKLGTEANGTGEKPWELSDTKSMAGMADS